MKRWNRRAENLLQRAEKWAAVADVLGGAPYRDELTEAWKLVLFNQFHALGGTSIAPAYEDSRDQYGHASSLAANAFNRAVQTISRRIDIRPSPSCGRSSSSTRTRGRFAATSSSSTRGCRPTVRG